MTRLNVIRSHTEQLRSCSLCPQMIGPVVSGGPVMSKVMLVGQAPGDKEGRFGKPFAWTAGKTLFKWFAEIGLDEDRFRSTVYMAAVCRCFPGKNPKGGDRVPDPKEIENCSRWLRQEVQILKPDLIIPVGKLAIQQFLPVEKLNLVIGKVHAGQLGDIPFELIPLPHPSGASTWHRMEPGRTLLKQSLQKIKKHPAYRALL